MQAQAGAGAGAGGRWCWRTLVRVLARPQVQTDAGAGGALARAQAQARHPVTMPVPPQATHSTPATSLFLPPWARPWMMGVGLSWSPGPFVRVRSLMPAIFLAQVHLKLCLGLAHVGLELGPELEPRPKLLVTVLGLSWSPT